MKRLRWFAAILWAASLALSIALVLKHARPAYIGAAVGLLGVTLVAFLNLVGKRKDDVGQIASPASVDGNVAAAPQESDRKQLESRSANIEVGLRAWFISAVVLLVLFVILGWFDNATELTPSHDNVLLACFAIGSLAALVFGGVTIHKLKKLPIWRRAVLTFSMAMLGLLSMSMAATRTASIIEGWIDFPSGKTRTYPALVLISRAYQTHGKGGSCNIQTTPIWSDIEITQDDYNFMLAHRRTGDAGRDPDEISSKGYFCAQVTMQQSGSALRILHAGSRKLPRGTVIICPSGNGASSRE